VVALAVWWPLATHSQGRERATSVVFEQGIGGSSRPMARVRPRSGGAWRRGSPRAASSCTPAPRHAGAGGHRGRGHPL